MLTKSGCKLFKKNMIHGNNLTFVSHLRQLPHNREVTWQELLNALNPLIQISRPLFLLDATQPNNVMYIPNFKLRKKKKNCTAITLESPPQKKWTQDLLQPCYMPTK